MPIDRLYPAVSFPVSRGTQMISPLILWDHSNDWFIPEFDMNTTKVTSERNVIISTIEPEYKYMMGHIIDGIKLNHFSFENLLF